MWTCISYERFRNLKKLETEIMQIINSNMVEKDTISPL
jgi:hypothetical protein